MSINWKHMCSTMHSRNGCTATLQSTWGRVSWHGCGQMRTESTGGYHGYVIVHGEVCLDGIWKACCPSAPSSLEKLSFAYSKTHARILTLQHFQEPLFTPAPESTPWKKETRVVKKHTSNKAKEFQMSLKKGKCLKTTARLFPKCPQSRRVNKAQYLLGL